MIRTELMSASAEYWDQFRLALIDGAGSSGGRGIILTAMAD